MSDNQATIHSLRRIANLAATRLIAGKGDVDDVVRWFMDQAAPYLDGAGEEETLK